MTAARRVAVRCPAKVNLHLEVLGRREDGFHELRTLFVAVGLWDELTFAVARPGEIALAVEPAGIVGAGEDNLVLRAARAAAATWGVARGARIGLRKRIPVAGGMGGGSADAAATLVGLADLWEVPEREAGLPALAASLGSDVPYFLVGGAAWGTGRGTELEPLPDLPEWWLVLLPGDEPVPTAQVYAALPPAAAGRRRTSSVYDWAVIGGELPLPALHNDLEGAVVARWPWVERRVQALRATEPLLAMVSGSGGTTFALFETQEKARGGAERLGSMQPLVVPLLDRGRSRLRATTMEGPWTSPR